MYMSMFFMIIFFIGLVSVSLNRYHLFMVLLCLEFFVLILFISMIFYLNFFNNETFFSMFFLVFSVCEGVLGICNLILLIRLHGNDYFCVLNIL
uniref:NADH-ubiquinone oxidoreductase chain 4L n=1 Tax=Athalia sp. 'qingzang' TaxID=2983452 RepID=A0A977TLD3_9HYME|nr:NADH dehydrogenase subunit 4L [Athalia japonica]UXW93538.1 NADH dehydrogenase subunit 4L [Athalia japonica]UXW93564.1 NADH dehydrogenase subunit 4L [Athalia sp. 'qingzang']